MTKLTHLLAFTAAVLLVPAAGYAKDQVTPDMVPQPVAEVPAMPISEPMAVAETPEVVPETLAPIVAGSTIQDYTSRLLALNQISPKQNPQYQLGTKALSRRLMDQNRRGLGEVTDITIGAGGNLASIQADVIATGFDQNLSFDVTAYNVSAQSDSYTVTLTRDQIKNNIPEFLANIETAGGDKVGQPITVKSLVGGRVQTNKGNQIAVVNDVLIDEKRKAAVALLLTLMGGSGRTTVAVPYADAKIERLGSKSTIELSEEQARVVSNFAHKKN